MLMNDAIKRLRLVDAGHYAGVLQIVKVVSSAILQNIAHH